MRWYLAHLETLHGFQALATGAQAFFLSVLVIAVFDFLFSKIGFPLGWLVRQLGWGYRLLITNLTRVAGTRYPPPVRWAFFVCWSIAFMAAVAFETGWPILILLSTGLVFVFVILQHCIWDEDEQSRDIIGNSKHINAKVDLRVEAVCAIALLFGLAAIGFSDLDRTYGVFASLPKTQWWFPFRALLYVWGEVPEGVPVIDSTSVFRNSNLLTGASYHDPMLVEATFLLRIVYEIFVVAALVQLALVAVRLAEKGRLGEVDRGLKFGDSRRQRRAMADLGRLALRHHGAAIRYLSDMLSQTRFSPDLRVVAAGSLVDVAKRWGEIGQFYEAANGYKLLSKDWTKDESPARWALIQNNLSVVLRILGEHVSGAEGIARLEDAATSSEAAIDVFSKNGMQGPWAGALLNLGATLGALGERLGGADGISRLEAACEAYEQALSVYTEMDTPRDWALAKNDLGIALKVLAKRLGGMNGLARLQAAVEAFNAALRVRTEKAAPVEWAATQNNLGSALVQLGELLEGDLSEVSFKAAAVSYRAALRVRTKKNMPIDWAATQNNLGIAQVTLGTLLGGASGIAELKEGVASYDASLAVRTERQLPVDWAATQNNLGVALAALGQLLDGHDGIAQIEAAVASYDAALRVRTEKYMPVDWAATQNNLGVALTALGERLVDAEAIPMFEAAIAACKAALRVRSEDDMPTDWAATQYNLGNALTALGIAPTASDSSAALVSAITAYEAALKVFNRIGDEKRAAIAGKGLEIATSALRALKGGTA